MSRQGQEINYPAIQKILLDAKNPFSNVIVENPHQEIVDVEAINADLTTLILEALQRIRSGEKRSEVILIQGEPGLGKTHFLSRMRMKAKEHDYVFVDLPPLGDISRIYSHIFQQLFVTLSWKGPEDRNSPLFELTARILSEMLIERAKNAELQGRTRQIISEIQQDPLRIFSYMEALANRDAVRDGFITQVVSYCMERYPAVDQLFLEVLFKILNPSLELIVLKWLKGYDLSEADLEQLNIKESINNDEIANRILNSLLMILNRPILFCLDQLESFSIRFEAENGIKILFDTLTNMYNRYQNICMLLMCQSHVWTEIEKCVEKSALDRIQTKKVLSKLSFEEGILLVESRLKLIYPPTLILPYSTYPFAHNYIRAILKEAGFNPRKLLHRLSQELELFQRTGQITERDEELTEEPEQIIERLPEVPPVESFIADELEKLKVSIQNESKAVYTYPVRQDFSRGILYELFKELKHRQLAIGGYQIIEVQVNQKVSKKDLDLLLTVQLNGITQRIGIEINNTENMTVMYHTVKRLLEEKANGHIERTYLFRDATLEIRPTAKKTLEYISELDKTGGFIVIPEEDTLLLMGMKKLVEKASGGDLMQGDKLITRADVMNYLIPQQFMALNSIARIFAVERDTKQPLTERQVSRVANAPPISNGIPELGQDLPKIITPPKQIPSQPLAPLQGQKVSDNLEDLFSDIPEIPFGPQSSPVSQPTSSPEEKSQKESIQETNLKGNILHLIRKQRFYTLRKLQESFQNFELSQIREMLYIMAQEKMIIVIHDRGEDFLFSIHPDFS